MLLGSYYFRGGGAIAEYIDEDKNVCVCVFSSLIGERERKKHISRKPNFALCLNIIYSLLAESSRDHHQIWVVCWKTTHSLVI